MLDHDFPHYLYMLPYLVFPQTVECGHQQYHIIGKQVTCQIKHITFRRIFSLLICSNDLDICYFLQYCFTKSICKRAHWCIFRLVQRVIRQLSSSGRSTHCPLLPFRSNSTEPRIIFCAYSVAHIIMQKQLQVSEDPLHYPVIPLAPIITAFFPPSDSIPNFTHPFHYFHLSASTSAHWRASSTFLPGLHQKIFI